METTAQEGAHVWRSHTAGGRSFFSSRDFAAELGFTTESEDFGIKGQLNKEKIMTGEVKSFGQQVTEKVVRVGIAIIGLLVLRGILSVMPMLRNEPIYTVTFPGVSALDTQNPLYWQQVLQAMSQPQLQGLIAEAERQELVDTIRRGQRTNDRTSVLQMYNESLMAEHLAIFPITIAKGVVDTLIFILVFLFGRNITFLFRTGYARFPDLGQVLNFGLLLAVAGIAYYSYQGLAYPFLFPDNYPIYGWVFLVLALAPLIALAVVVARNMDAITAMVMQSGSTVAAVPAAVAAGRCSSCGAPITAAAKFCPSCGSASNAPAPITSGKKICQACGAENLATARFCKDCGRAA